MPSVDVTLKALGLDTNPNEIAAPPGALKTASNVIIRRDNIVEPRRGFRQYGTEFGTITDRAKQILEYRNRILRHYSDVLQFDTQVENIDGESIFQSFNGTVVEAQEGLRIKSAESNGNLYFTTNDGIKKISSATPEGLSDASIVNAGGIKATNIDTRLSVTLGSTTGFLPDDSVVAYRVVWGKKDVNNNLILGTPSERSVIYNSLQQMIVRDLLNVLSALDSLNTTGSYINDGNYVSTLKLPLSASATSIRDNLIALASKIDNEFGQLSATADIASASITGGICTITFSASYYNARQYQPGDLIYLNNFVVSGGNLTPIDGVQTVITVVGSGGATPTITFATQSTSTIAVSSANIQSGWFRAIAEPSEPSITPTHAQLQELQDYLSNIIVELQSSRNIRSVAQFGGGPLDLSNVAGSGTAVTFTTASDVRNYLTNSDLINLSGTFTSYSSLLGVQTINATALTNTTFKLTSAVTGTYTGSTNDTIDRILRFTDALQETYILPLQVTTTANVFVDITVPDVVTITDFYQIYRSNIKTASQTDVLADLVPDDTMRQVYEDFPTQAQIDAGELSVEDIVSDVFYQGGAFLYTNADDRGGGILQANDPPPFAKDINRFKNVLFYANTKTLQREQLSLLGVVQILADYDAGFNPEVTITADDITSSYRFIKGISQAVQLVCGAFANISTGGYFLINTGNNTTRYYVWFDKTGSDVDPAIANRTGIKIIVQGLTTAAQIAQRLTDTLSIYVDDFTPSISSSTVTITNVTEGPADSPSTSGLAAPFAISVTTTGDGEKTTQEITTINAVAGNLYVTSGTADYFTLNTPFDRNLYYFWFNVSGGTMTNPNLNGRTGIQISIANTDTAGQVATAISTAINLHEFSSTVLSNVITVTTTQLGPTINATEVVANAGFTVAVIQQGALNVLLSNSDSVGIAVESTAKSLVNVVNHDKIMPVSGFYMSGLNDVPGIVLFEAQDLSVGSIYFCTNRTNTGNSFSPTLKPTSVGITNSAANPTVITFASHGLLDGDQILISGSNSVPLIDGIRTIKKINANTFTIPVNVITGGTAGAFSKLSALVVSDNEVKANRIYYSKLQQPEAVPIVNYFDVGSSDKEIVRIFPLMNSLFVFKQDGLYRVSGETSPWTVELFDTSCVLLCPDSLAVANNYLFGFTALGISSVTENGSNKVSQPIDNILQKLNTDQYTFFNSASWGVGYDTDNSYLFFTVQKTSDEVATICYRYSTLSPPTWTTYDLSETCGVVYNHNLLYFGSGTTNKLEEERKTFTRTDYADFEYVRDIATGGYNDSIITFANEITQLEAGDVIYQEQPITAYNFNSLLRKLDYDPSVSPTYTITNAVYSSGSITFTTSATVDDFLQPNDEIIVAGINPVLFNGSYIITSVSASTVVVTSLVDPGTYISDGTLDFSYLNTFEQGAGANMRTALVDLAAKLDIDPGLVLTNYSSSIANYSGINASASAINPTDITYVNHGLLTTRYVQIAGSTTSPNINGRYNVTVIDADNFTIPQDVLTAGLASFETLIDNFNDIKACYNILIDNLNADEGAAFANYLTVNTLTPFECVIDDVNYFTHKVTLNKAGLEFIVGPVTIYKSYLCDLEYLPTTLENYMALKQFSEAQFMFLNKTFSTGSMKFSSDLIPATTRIAIEGFGNGILGNERFGENYFGGDSHSAPFRTYIPRPNQKCRFLRIGFEHQVAREKFSLLGITVTGRQISNRAYR